LNESKAFIDLCLVAGRFSPHYAGPSERFRRYAPALRELGVNLRVITVRRSYDELAVDQVDDIPVERHSILADDDTARTSTSRLLPSVFKSFRKTGQWPDVLQLLTPPMAGDVPLLWQARANGLPIILVSTMMLDEISGLRARLYNAWIFSPFNLIVTSSSVMTDQLAGRVSFPKRIETIPNGVDCRRFHPVESAEERAKLRQRFGFDPDDEIIIYVGSITPRKGVDTLVTAWQEIIKQRPRARLLLVGPHRRSKGAEPADDAIIAFCDKMDALISQSTAPARVTFTGEVRNVEDYLQAADIFVFPSISEGMPNVVPEAMAVGLPCVMTPFKGLPTEFGKSGRDYILVEHQPLEIAGAVLDLCCNTARRSNISNNALAWVKKNLDVKMSLYRYAQLYRRLAKPGQDRINIV